MSWDNVNMRLWRLPAISAPWHALGWSWASVVRKQIGRSETPCLAKGTAPGPRSKTHQKPSKSRSIVEDLREKIQEPFDHCRVSKSCAQVRDNSGGNRLYRSRWSVLESGTTHERVLSTVWCCLAWIPCEILWRFSIARTSNKLYMFTAVHGPSHSVCNYLKWLGHAKTFCQEVTVEAMRVA